MRHLSGPIRCATTRPALTPNMRLKLMSKATLTLKSTAAVSKIDGTLWSRELWKATYGMARRMVRQRPGHSTGDALTWFFDHGFRRFGYAALPVVRAAGWAVFDQVHVTKAATGTREELARQGMLTRCVRLERAPRGGWSWAWTHDELAAVNLNRSRRVHLARQRRAVARAMAEDRRALKRGPLGSDRYALTVVGVLALRAAEAARATA